MIPIALKCSHICQAYGYFTSIILIGLGFSVEIAQLLVSRFERTFYEGLSIDSLGQVAPTAVSAAVFALCLSRVADRYRKRGPIVRVVFHPSFTWVYQTNTKWKIVFQSLLAIIGLSLMGFHPKSSVGPYDFHTRTEESLTQC